MSKHSLLKRPLVLGKLAASRGKASAAPCLGRWMLWRGRLLGEPSGTEEPGLASPEEEPKPPGGPPTQAQLQVENPKGITPGPMVVKSLITPTLFSKPRGSPKVAEPQGSIHLSCVRYLGKGNSAKRDLNVAFSNRQEKTKISPYTMAWGHRDSCTLGLILSCILNYLPVSLCIWSE